MPCSSTSQLTNAPTIPLPLAQPTTPAQWNVFVSRLQQILNGINSASTRQPVNVVPTSYAVYNGSSLPALVVTGATASLDTTKHLFGSASLKLVATASTVTLEFSADPVIIAPFCKWVESVYIQSSRASITGTLAMSTDDAEYPVNISGNLTPANWGRLYGDCDLTADAATTCTLVLTLTGCNVGDTFNFDGWQIEKAGADGSLPSAFVNTTADYSYVVTADNAQEALANADAAQASATSALNQLDAIASDGNLTPPEKGVVIRDYQTVTNEQAGIDAQAVAYLGTGSSQQVAYDNAISALTSYLGSLTTPTAWNDQSGSTTIVGSTFDSTWEAVYSDRQALLNAIYAKAQALANNAQSSANTAQTAANNAQSAANAAQASATAAENQLSAIASDGILSPAEKPTVMRDYSVITTEQSGIDAQAVSFLGTGSTDQTAYDNAITALTSYLNGLTTPTAWNDKSGNTTIVGSTFRSNFDAVYTTRQTLLNAIYAQAQALANTAQGTANTANANTPTVLNPNFLDGSSGWLFSGQLGWAPATNEAVFTGASNTTGTQSLANANNVPCNPGDAILTQALVSCSGVGSGDVYCGAEFLNASRGHVAYLFGNQITGTTGATLSQAFSIAPASSAFVRLFVAAANCTAGTATATACLLQVAQNASQIQYADGSTVESLRPAAAGADVTAHNQSASTATLSNFSTSNLTEGTNQYFTASRASAAAPVQSVHGRTGAVASAAGDYELDQVNDGTTYQRMPAANMDANRRALIDFTQVDHIGKTLANMPDDATSGRYAVSNIDGNRRALIDATQAGHVGAWNLDSRVADGTTYARTSSGALTGGNVDLAKAGVVNKNLGNIADGGGRYGVHAVDSNNLALVDFSQAGHLNKNLDNIGNGTTYARPLATQLQNGVPRSVNSGRNLISNGGFESNASGSACGDGWDGGGGLFGVVRTNAGAGVAHSGAYVLQVNAAPGTVIPTGSTFGAANNFGVACNAGDTLYMGAWFKNMGNPAAFPAGITGTLTAQIVFLDASNNAISTLPVYANLTASGWQQVTTTGVVPAGTVSACAQVLVYTSNTTGSAWTVPAGQYPFFAYVDDLFAYAITNLDTDAKDGVINGRMAMADAFNVGGANRVGLRVAGSGQSIGDQRNLLPVTFASVGSTTNNAPLSWSISGTFISFVCAATTIYAGSASASFSASSITVTQAAGTTQTWYLFYLNNGFAGGTTPLHATTDYTGLAQIDGATVLGRAVITIAAAGGGSSGSGGGTNPNFGGCVRDTMYLDAGRQAHDAEAGDVFDCIDLPGELGKHQRKLVAVEHSVQPCVRLVTDRGAILECSESTPFDTPDGRTFFAPKMVGEQVVTDQGIETVMTVARIGEWPVAHCFLGGVSYAAGVDPTHRIYSHNIQIK